VLQRDATSLSDDDRETLADVARAVDEAVRILRRGDSPPTQTEPAPPNVTPPDAALVLVADDDSAMRKLVCRTLASQRFHVLEAADGEEAWRLIREHRPAIAILDWQMPVYSGLELSDVIKGDPRVQATTVIMLTGRSAPADREAGARARADMYLTKPCSPDELLDAVQRALAKT
jgi:two-component system chemotaxis response regulator CheY